MVQFAFFRFVPSYHGCNACCLSHLALDQLGAGRCVFHVDKQDQVWRQRADSLGRRVLPETSVPPTLELADPFSIFCRGLPQYICTLHASVNIDTYLQSQEIRGKNHPVVVLPRKDPRHYQDLYPDPKTPREHQDPVEGPAAECRRHGVLGFIEKSRERRRLPCSQKPPQDPVILNSF